VVVIPISSADVHRETTSTRPCRSRERDHKHRDGHTPALSHRRSWAHEQARCRVCEFSARASVWLPRRRTHIWNSYRPLAAARLYIKCGRESTPTRTVGCPQWPPSPRGGFW